MSVYRKNTLVVDFSVLPKRPPLEQVEEFLKKFMKLDMADVKSIQLHNLNKCVYIEMIDASVAPRLHKQHHLQYCFVHEGVTYYIPVYVDGPTTTVRILDLPPHMSNDVITKHLQQYGKVISIQNEVWKHFFPGVPNGVRIVRMRIEKTLPSCIVIESHSTVINFPSSKQSVRVDPKQQAQTQSTDVNGQTKNDKQPVRRDAPVPPSNDCDGSNASETESDDEHEKAEMDHNGDQHGSETTELESGKRRLSTEAIEKVENIPKRTCNQSEPGTEWRVHNTRSRKNKKLCDVLC
uniref:Putative translation elongation factor ef-1 alpha/tu n=1 Tax=Aedes aegypti TaxID=7159 RepID=A0A0P6K0Q4_AEDAE